MRTLLLIDGGCASRVPQTVASCFALPTSQLTVVAVPRLPAFWGFAALSGQTTTEDLQRDALEEATVVLRRVVDALPMSCSVEHRVLAGWREVGGLLRGGAFAVAVLAVRPKRRVLRALLATGTAVVHAR